MHGLKVKIIRARHVDEDVGDLKNNVVFDGHGLLTDIKNLSCKCNMLDKDFYTLICKELRDGFTPYTSLTTNDGILLHTFKLQPIDLTNDNCIHTHPINLGHKINKMY